VKGAPRPSLATRPGVGDVQRVRNAGANVDTIRHVLAVLVAISVPPGVGLWLVIHPLAGFWRRFGAGGTYAILALPWAASLYGLYRVRDVLLGPDWGTRAPTIVGGVLCLAVSLRMALLRRKHLTFRILAGVPELSSTEDRRRLLTTGVYGRIRHPRYVEFLVGVLGYILIANYAHLYVGWLLTALALYLVVVLEERELRRRFGAAYDEYARSVPRFLPVRRSPGR